jgi:hypothetical protein
MTADYYARTATHLNGSNVFATDEDNAAQVQAAQAIGRGFGCEVHHFGHLAAIDCYATRAGRLVGVIEIKHRTHAIATYPTVYLNLRKWMALTLAAVGVGVPGLFVVAWVDALGWVDVADVDPRRIKVGGLVRQVKSCNDIEPVIEIPTAQFRLLPQGVPA